MERKRRQQQQQEVVNTIVTVSLLLLAFVDAFSSASFLLPRLLLISTAQNDTLRKISPSPSADPPLLQQQQQNPDLTRSSIPPPIKPENPNPSSNTNINQTVANDANATITSTSSPNKTTPTSTTSSNNNNEGVASMMHPHGGRDKQEEDRIDVNETCNGVPRRCTDRSSLLIACIVNFYDGSKQVEVLVQNEGESMLQVNLSALSPIDNALLEIQKHRAKKVNLTVGETSEVTLSARAGDCILHVDHPVPGGNFILYLPSFDKLVTPVNGAYFLILTAIVFGGTWICCVCCKKRRGGGGGVPYQELEMGLPDSSDNVETADGWDEGWDDDWNEENAMKSPAARVAASISGNGLTSRTTNKDGWGNDRDE